MQYFIYLFLISSFALLFMAYLRKRHQSLSIILVPVVQKTDTDSIQ